MSASEPRASHSLGVVTDGGFAAGLTVRLHDAHAETLQVGSFVVVDGDRNRYFSLVADLQLRVTDPNVASDPPVSSPLLRAALQGIHTYVAAEIRPSLVIEDVGGDKPSAPRPARTVPSHFSVMRQADEADFEQVFGKEGGTKFGLGQPIAMDGVSITIDLERLVERPSGVFGQTGTGKSVLTRLLLYGVLTSDVANALIFDMHSEYALERSDRPGIPGLVDLFNHDKVRVFSLDHRASNGTTLKIGMNQIDPEDIALLSEELGLPQTYDGTSLLLQRAFREEWLSQLLRLSGDTLREFVENHGAHEGAVTGLQRRLRFLQQAEYVQEHQSDSQIEEIVELLRKGKSVVVQFGRYDGFRDYMLVTNLLTRRIHEKYRDAAEHRTGKERGLVIVLEEAHKFLSPQVARQSIFGTIAREMRKFGVTLLIVDQRPSQIDSEVLSQVATRISGLVTNDDDISAIVSGASDRNALRSMLASLDQTQQCLVLGHAIPMPMIVRTREYSRALIADPEVDKRKQDGMALIRGLRPERNR